MLQLIVVSIFYLTIGIHSIDKWSYENTKFWSTDNQYCGGNSQSPIDLRYNFSRFDNRWKQIYLEERSPAEPNQLINNGHTVQLNLRNRYVLKNVAPHTEDYKVEQIHFHWGHSNQSQDGSEHLIEGRSYPLEMHVVTYSSLYSNIQEAAPNTRALAVIGLFFELSDIPNPYIQSIIDGLIDIKYPTNHTSIPQNFDLKQLISSKRMRRYYRYDGSLTTPPCYESVIWNVLVEPSHISWGQFRAFLSLQDEKFKSMKNTYRKIQPLGTRKLFRSFHSGNIRDNDSKEQISMPNSHEQYLHGNIIMISGLLSFLMIKII